MDLKGDTITIDAMGCQTAIAQKIITQHGDYLLIVKDNQKNLRKAIEQTMPAEIAKSRKSRFDSFETYEKGMAELKDAFVILAANLCAWEPRQNVGPV